MGLPRESLRSALRSESITTPEQFLEWDQEHFAKAVATLKAAKGEDLVKELNFHVRDHMPS
jgi:hypothetical protein